MDVTLSSVLKNPKPVLFNLDGLDDKGVAKIDQSVKSAKETLALADNLQSMRDVNRTLARLSNSLRSGSSLGGRRLINFSL